MGRLKYLFIHCSDTPSDRTVSILDLERWHRSPKENSDGTWVYFGEKYSKFSDMDIMDIHKGTIGNGWDRLGYSDLIHRTGVVENITPYNADEFVSNNEMTWGARGYNSNSRHVCLSGGKGATSDSYFFHNFTEEQWMALRSYLLETISDHPDILIGGHNQISYKACPGFSVIEELQIMGIPRKNWFVK